MSLLVLRQWSWWSTGQVFDRGAGAGWPAVAGGNWTRKFRAGDNIHISTDIELNVF